MIFHTAAERKYYDAFFKRWHTSILKHYPSAKFSLRYVGDVSETDVSEYASANGIMLSVDPTTPAQLIDRYGSIDVARGYYPMARWNSIPDSDHVCVTDVDVVMIKNDVDRVEELLNTHDFVSISRLKVTKINLMMVNYINKNACATVRDHALSLMDHPEFRWDIDLDVMSFMKKNLKFDYHHRLVKLDRKDDLIPRLLDEASFAYYSAIAVSINGVDYPGGYEAKKAKYEWADANDMFTLASNQSSSLS